MATGSVFQLQVNDGSKQDVNLTQTDQLSEYMNRVSADKARAYLRNEMSKSGVAGNAVNQSTAGMNYEKIREYARSFGVKIPAKSEQDIAPTFREISNSHVFHMYAQFKPYVALAFEYERIPAKGVARFAGSQGSNDSNISFIVTTKAAFINDIVLHLQLSAATGTNNTPLVQVDMIKYAELLGHRIVRRTRLKINANPIDEYTSDDMNAHMEYSIPYDKREGYYRAIGQEIPHMGYLTPEPRTDQFRQVMYVADGNQTLTLTKPVTNLWIPSIFWFMDPNQSLPHIAVPYGQTEISYELASVAEIMACVDAVAAAASQAFTPPTIQIAELYVKHIQTNPEITDLIVKRIGYSMIRVHRQQTKLLSIAPGQQLLNEMKWPLEKLMIAFRPVANEASVDFWHWNTALTANNIVTPVWTTIPAPAIATNNIVYQTETPTVTQLSLEAHGNILYPFINQEFYNHYIAYANGGINWRTPHDPGWYLFLLCLKPDEYNPSGHLDTSQARELYLRYQSNFISTANVVRLVMCAIVINFLLTADGSTVIRYST